MRTTILRTLMTVSLTMAICIIGFTGRFSTPALAACNFTGFSEPTQFTNYPFMSGIFASLTTADTTINFASSDHESNWIQVGDVANYEWAQFGMTIGVADGYIANTLSIYTETSNPNMYGSQLNKVDYHVYGGVPSMGGGAYGYSGYVYYSGYADTSKSPVEYEYYYDQTNYGVHLTYPGYITEAQATGRAAAEVYQASSSTNCEDISGYFGAGPNGVPYNVGGGAMMLKTNGNWTDWNSSIPSSATQGQQGSYTWTLLRSGSFDAGHGQGV